MGSVEEIVLHGGVANQGAVVRIGDTVRRPQQPHTSAVAALLEHLESVGFDGAPRFLGIDERGREVLSWIPGSVPLPPFPSWAMSDAALAGLARLLRAYHDATDGFLSPDRYRGWSGELTDPEGGDVICHNDICPENVVFRDGEPVALLDFDFSAPGRRVWDVVTTASMWVPLTAPTWRKSYPPSLDAVERVGIFADAYGLDETGRAKFLPVLEQRWQVGRAFTRRRLDAGEKAFEEMVAEHGADERWSETDTWIKQQQPHVEQRLTGLTDRTNAEPGSSGPCEARPRPAAL